MRGCRDELEFSNLLRITSFVVAVALTSSNMATHSYSPPSSFLTSLRVKLPDWSWFILSNGIPPLTYERQEGKTPHYNKAQNSYMLL